MADLVPFGTGNFLSRRDPFGLDFWDRGFFKDFFGSSGSFKVDVQDKGDHYEVKADLPGLDKDHIDVRVENSIMTITANTNEETKKESDGYIMSERMVGTSSRAFTIGDVKAEDIKGTYKEGVLTLNVPKAKDQKDNTNRKVEIK